MLAGILGGRRCQRTIYEAEFTHKQRARQARGDIRDSFCTLLLLLLLWFNHDAATTPKSPTATAREDTAEESAWRKARRTGQGAHGHVRLFVGLCCACVVLTFDLPGQRAKAPPPEDLYYRKPCCQLFWRRKFCCEAGIPWVLSLPSPALAVVQAPRGSVPPQLESTAIIVNGTGRRVWKPCHTPCLFFDGMGVLCHYEMPLQNPIL